MRIATLVVLLVVAQGVFGCRRRPRPPPPRPPTSACYCVTATRLNIRGSACGPVIGTEARGSCFRYTGAQQTCTIGGTAYTFYRISYNGRVGWAAKNYLAVGNGCGGSGSNQCSGLKLVSRSGWGARAPKSSVTLRKPLGMAFIHHTTGPRCTSRAACVGRAKSIQNYHMNNLGWSDVGYNFFIGEDGYAYEGRGWTRVGAHAIGYNSASIGISFIGDFTSVSPSSAAIATAKKLLACGVQKGFLRSTYELFGHRDGGYTACPGNTLYPIIRTWPRYSRRTIPKYR